MEKNEIIVKTLKELGFDPVQCEDIGYRFEMEGINMMFVNDDEDEKLVRVAVPAIFEVSDENRCLVPGMLNALNTNLKYVKAIEANDSIWLLFEHFLVRYDSLGEVLTCMIYSLQHAYQRFCSVIEAALEEISGEEDKDDNEGENKDEGKDENRNDEKEG